MTDSRWSIFMSDIMSDTYSDDRSAKASSVSKRDQDLRNPIYRFGATLFICVKAKKL